MAAHDGYGAQVELLIRCLPAIARAPDFAVKSDTALTDIRAQLAAVPEGLKWTVPSATVQLVEGGALKLLVDKSAARIKVNSSVPRPSWMPWPPAAVFRPRPPRP